MGGIWANRAIYLFSPKRNRLSSCDLPRWPFMIYQPVEPRHQTPQCYHGNCLGRPCSLFWKMEWASGRSVFVARQLCQCFTVCRGAAVDLFFPPFFVTEANRRTRAVPAWQRASITQLSKKHNTAFSVQLMPPVLVILLYLVLIKKISAAYELKFLLDHIHLKNRVLFGIWIISVVWKGFWSPIYMC